MAQLTIAVQSVPAGAVRHSSSRNIPGVTRDLTIQLTDSGAWATTTGNILIWGWQLSTDGGTTWVWRQWQPGRPNPDDTSDGAVLPFGTVGKNGLLPSMRVSGADLIADAGHQARLAIQVDTTISLGATITTG